MNDSSDNVNLIFATYKDMGIAKPVLLTLVLVGYLVCIIVNVIMMLLIYMDTSLHKPMYIFLFSLILNGLIGSTAVWPKVMDIILTDNNTISYSGCIFQISLIRLYGACNYTMLTVMAYDRFVSIFNPLEYQIIMNPDKVKFLVSVGNLIPLCYIICDAYLLSRVPLCRYILHRVFCDQVAITDLSCDNKSRQIVQAFGTLGVVCIVVLPVLLIILSYLKILLLIQKFSADVRKKTFSTCSPHLIFFITFTFASLFSIFFNRAHPIVSAKAKVIRAFFISTSYILLPPLLHPLMYGFNNKDIRAALMRIRKRAVFSSCKIIPKLKLCEY